jgi:hypothetical protein
MLHVVGSSTCYGMPSVKRDEATRLAIREWMQQIIDETGMSAIKLAEIAGTSANTVYRALDPNGEFMTSTTTLMKVARATRRDLPAILRMPSGTYQPAEHIRPFSGLSPVDEVNNGIWLDAETRRQFWRVNDRALELEGYLPGDIIATDPELMPATGDIVCAQVTSTTTKETETVLRLYEAPYLLTRSWSTETLQFSARPLRCHGK